MRFTKDCVHCSNDAAEARAKQGNMMERDQHAGDCETIRGRKLARPCSECGKRFPIKSRRATRKRCDACIGADPAVQRRREKAAAQERAQRASEADALDIPLWRDGRWNLPAVQLLVSYIGKLCKTGQRPYDHALDYVWTMARFHAGLTGGSLYGPMSVVYLVDRDVRPLLDELADAVAEIAYGRGRSMTAARIWYRALHGETL